MTGDSVREVLGARLQRVGKVRYGWFMVRTMDLILCETGCHSEKEEHDLTYILTESVWLTKDL